MKLSRILSLAAIAVGTVASTKLLQKRHAQEQRNNKVGICVDFDDVIVAALRAGITFDDLAQQLVAKGATHISLPEMTLNGLIKRGVLQPMVPAEPLSEEPPLGQWVYLYGTKSFIPIIESALNWRLPELKGQMLGENTLVFAGSLPAHGDLGLGFDEAFGEHLQSLGLAVVPRPVSYDWPDPALIDHGLHSAGHVGKLIAFDGDWVLGHEMQINDTLKAMNSFGLSMAYFAESRHQRGDWFIAKGRLPHVVLAHRFTQAEMMEMDYHSAAHTWVHLANERGIRLCYINFFRVLHATAPLEGLDYVHYLKHALEDAGYQLSQDLSVDEEAVKRSEAQPQELALAGVAAAGIGAAAISDTLNLPESLAVPFVTLASMGAAALPFVEQKGMLTPAPHSHGDDDGHDHGRSHSHSLNGLNGVEAVHAHGGAGHHHHGDGDVAPMQTSFAPKLIALATSTLAPAAALTSAQRDGWLNWLIGQSYMEAGAVTLAAATSEIAYRQRVEAFRGWNLDWFVPLTVAALQFESPKTKAIMIAILTGAWLAAQKSGDLLGKIDAPHAEGHTHHVSVANRIVGDLSMKLGLKPARKWAWVGPLALSLADGEFTPAQVMGFTGTVANTMSLSAYRHPERAIERTARGTIPAWAAGYGLGLAGRLM